MIIGNKLISCEVCIADGWRDVYGTCVDVTCPDRRIKEDSEIEEEKLWNG